jgi:hypothetical protein
VTRYFASHLGEAYSDSFGHPSDETAKEQSAAVPYNGTFNPMVRRIVFAALCGTGFTSLLSLTLNVPYVNLLAGLLLLPGGLLQSLLRGADSPIAVLLANFLVYAVLFFVITSYSSEVQRKAESRRLNLWLAFPVGVLACMACVPRLDPLWPTGMTELSRQEAQLRESLPVDIDLQQARGVLRSEGIEFWEHVEKDDNVIFTRPEGNLKVISGDTVVSAKVWTKAGQFPCSYRIDIVLVFGKEARLTDRSIHPLRICP